MLPNYDNSAARRRFAQPSARSKSRISNLAGSLIAAPVDLNVQIPDLLPECITVESEQVGGSDLIAPRRGQCSREQWNLDFLENSMIEPRGRYTVWKS